MSLLLFFVTFYSTHELHLFFSLKLEHVSEAVIDAEVAMATAQGLSRQSSIGSLSRDSPSEPSEEEDSTCSSPVENS